jgi:RNA recognition motif-containing protein
MNIFVGNLSRDVNEKELRQLFEEFGDVTSAAVIKDKMTGQSRGFGFVEMSDSEAADSAINALNGRQVKGRAINVNEARPRAERPGGGGGRGDRPSRGGGGGGYRGGYRN